MTPELVTTARIDAFQRDGFVVVDGLLTTDELDHYGPLVIDAVHTRAGADTRPLDERSPYEQSFQQCINLWEDHPALRPLTFHQRIGHAAAELLGVDALRLWHDQALFKPRAAAKPTHTKTSRTGRSPNSTRSPRGSHSPGRRSRTARWVTCPARTSSACASSRTSSSPTTRGRCWSHRRSQASRPSTSRCREARCRSTPASPCTWRNRTRPPSIARCTR